MKLLRELVGKRAPEDRHGPSGQVDVRGPRPPRPRARRRRARRSPASRRRRARGPRPRRSRRSRSPRSPPLRARRSARGSGPGASGANHDTFVRFGNSSWCSIARPDRREVECGERPRSRDPDRALRVADLDVLKAPRLPAGRRARPRRRARPPGKSALRSRARPISSGTVGDGDRRPGSRPAAVWIENVSCVVQPLRRRYRIASRAPLPDSSASEPSGLKIRSVATKARARSGVGEQQDPVGEHPRVGRADAPGSGPGSARTGALVPRGSHSRCRAPATSRSPRGGSVGLPAPRLATIAGCARDSPGERGGAGRRGRWRCSSRSCSSRWGCAPRGSGEPCRSPCRTAGDHMLDLRRGLLRQRGPGDRRGATTAGKAHYAGAPVGDRPERRASSAGQADHRRLDRAVRRRAAGLATGQPGVRHGRDPRDVRARSGGRRRALARPLSRRR